jgi:hypothetical protein
VRVADELKQERTRMTLHHQPVVLCLILSWTGRANT